MANHPSWPMGDSVVTILGWITIIRALQQMGPADAFFLPRDASPDGDHLGHDIHEVCNAGHSDS